MSAMSRREMEFLIRFQADASQAVNIMRTQLQGVATQVNNLNKNMSAAGIQANKAMQSAANSTKQAHRQTNELVGSLHNLRGAFAALGVGLFAKALLDSSIAADKMNAKLKFTFGTTEQVADVSAYLRSEANRLGTSFVNLTSQFGSFAAASQATGMTLEQIKGIFRGVGEAGTALQLSGEEMKGTFFAIQQMMSKGKVNAEEFRLQLAERLPIALTAATRALGVTSKEFTRMLENGELISSEFLPKFAAQLSALSKGSLSTAMNSVSANIERVKNVFVEFFQTIGRSGVSDSFKDLLITIQGSKDGFQTLAQVIGVALTMVLKFVDTIAKLVKWVFDLGDGMGGLIVSIVGVAGVFYGLTKAAGVALATMGLFTAATVPAVAANAALATSNTVVAASFLATLAPAIAAGVAALGTFLLAALPIVAVLGSLVTLGAAFNYTIKETEGIDHAANAFNWLGEKIRYVYESWLMFFNLMDTPQESLGRFEANIEGAGLSLQQFGYSSKEAQASLAALQPEAARAAEVFKNLFDMENTNDGSDFSVKLKQIQDDFAKFSSEMNAAVNNFAASRGTDAKGLGLANILDQALVKQADGAIGVQKEFLTKLDEMKANATITEELYAQIMNILYAAVGKANGVRDATQDLKKAQDEISKAGGELVVSLNKSNSQEAAILAGIQASGKSLEEQARAVEFYKSNADKFATLSPAEAAKQATAASELAYNSPFEVFGRQADDALEAAKEGKKTYEKAVEELKNNKFENLLIDIMPESERVKAEAQKSLQEVLDFYKEIEDAGVKFTEQDMAKRTAIIAAATKKISEAQVESARLAAEENIEALRKIDTVSSQMQAAIEQLNYDAKYKTGQMADFFMDAFDRASDVIADFVTTGKFEISDFANWAAKELAKIALKDIGLSFMNSQKSSGGGGGGFLGSILGAVFHKGGIVGSGSHVSRALPANTWANAPRFHNGLRGDEFPAILQRGETVIPKNQDAGSFMGGGGGVTIPIAVNVNVAGGSGGTTGTDAQKIGAQVADAVRTEFYAMLDKEQRPGGRLPRGGG